MPHIYQKHFLVEFIIIYRYNIRGKLNPQNAQVRTNIYISRRHKMISESVCKATDLMPKQDFMSKEMS